MKTLTYAVMVLAVAAVGTGWAVTPDPVGQSVDGNVAADVRGANCLSNNGTTYSACSSGWHWWCILGNGCTQNVSNLVESPTGLQTNTMRCPCGSGNYQVLNNVQCTQYSTATVTPVPTTTPAN